jgi:hypothetical protein
MIKALIHYSLISDSRFPIPDSPLHTTLH